MPDTTVTPPVIGKKRAAAIDAAVDDASTGGDSLSAVIAPKPRHPAARTPTPERNDTYDDMESRIYGDKSAKTKR